MSQRSRRIGERGGRIHTTFYQLHRQLIVLHIITLSATQFFRDDKKSYVDLHRFISTWESGSAPGRPLPPYPDVPGPLYDADDPGLGLPGWLKEIRASK